MGSTAIQLAQAAAAEMGLPVVPYLYSANADNTGRQLGALLNRLGQMIQRAADWTYLTAAFFIAIPAPVVGTGTLTAGSDKITALSPGTAAAIASRAGQMLALGPGLLNSTRVVAVDTGSNVATIGQPPNASTTAASLQFCQDTYPHPADWSRPINRTAWDRSMRWEMRGPLSPQWDEWVRSGIVATGPRRMYREISGAWRIWPPPGTSSSDTGAVIGTEYISTNWALSTGGTGKPAFTVDSDTAMFPDDLMIPGLKYLFFQMKGFSYDELKVQFTRMLQTEIATDGPSPTLDMTQTKWPIFISPANVQDTGFGNP